MRNRLSDTLEEHRIQTGPFASTREWGPVGAFIVPRRLLGPHRFGKVSIIADDGTNEANPTGWEHVSARLRSGSDRLLTWNEMCRIKDAFWRPEEVVMQLHPARSEYVNTSEALHLWRPVEGGIPTPPKELVGIQGLRLDETPAE